MPIENINGWYVNTDTSLSGLGNVYQSVFEDINNLNKLQMEREDSAYQRMVADMKKAGLNPWSGLSSGGLSSGSLSSPRQSALDSLLSVLKFNETEAYHNNSLALKGVNTAIRIALPFLSLAGI